MSRGQIRFSPGIKSLVIMGAKRIKLPNIIHWVIHFAKDYWYFYWPIKPGAMAWRASFRPEGDYFLTNTFVSQRHPHSS
jgi:hypothetical protein